VSKGQTITISLCPGLYSVMTELQCPEYTISQGTLFYVTMSTNFSLN